MKFARDQIVIATGNIGDYYFVLRVTTAVGKRSVYPSMCEDADLLRDISKKWDDTVYGTWPVWIEDETKARVFCDYLEDHGFVVDRTIFNKEM